MKYRVWEIDVDVIKMMCVHEANVEQIHSFASRINTDDDDDDDDDDGQA